MYHAAMSTPPQLPYQYQPAYQPQPIRATSYAAAYAPQQPPNHHQPAYVHSYILEPQPMQQPICLNSLSSFQSLHSKPHGRRDRASITTAEQTYRGPRPTIPYFSHRDPCEFACMKIALENLLPVAGTEIVQVSDLGRSPEVRRGKVDSRFPPQLRHALH